MIVFAVGLLLLGALLGAGGPGGLGRAIRRAVKGPWRPGVGTLAVLILVAALLFAARAAWLEALIAAVIGFGLAFAARLRARPPPAAAAAPGLSRREAAAVLGVSTDADAEAVQAAYLRLMRMTHPDRGGTAGIAAQLNAAREAMLRR